MEAAESKALSRNEEPLASQGKVSLRRWREGDQKDLVRICDNRKVQEDSSAQLVELVPIERLNCIVVCSDLAEYVRHVPSSLYYEGCR